MSAPTDLFVIGGGINGTGIARDAAGRGLSVRLAEQGDLAGATSSASTKLFHGGLRYLEFLELRLVRESLREREVLLRAMPHIAWPMRFVLPLDPKMRFAGQTPVSRVLSVLMPWARGHRTFGGCSSASRSGCASSASSLAALWQWRSPC